MMKLFRNQGIKNTVYPLIVVAISAVFLIQYGPKSLFGGGGGASKASNVSSNCVAEVRGECLTTRDYRTTLALLQRRQLDDAARSNLPRTVIDGLVERALLTQDATRLGLALSDDDLNVSLTGGRVYFSLPAETLATAQGRDDMVFMPMQVAGPDGQFDQKLYERSLRSLGRGPADFRETQQAELLAARVRSVVASHVRVSDAEAFETYARDKSTASIRYARLPRGWFAKHAVASDDAAVTVWGAAHKEEVDKAFEARKAQLTPECKRVHALILAVRETASDDDKAAKRKAAEDARARVAKGERFADVARTAGDREALPPDGDVGCLKAATYLPKQVSDAAATLKDGDVAPVVEGEHGFFVVKLDATLTGDAAETEGRREVTKDMMVKVESETKAAEAAKKLRDDLAAGKPFDAALASVSAAYAPHAPPPVKLGGADKAAKPANADKAAADKTAKAGADDKAAKPGDDKGAKASDDDALRVEEARDFTATASPLRGAQANVAALALALDKPGDVPSDVVKMGDGYAVIQLIDKKPATREAFEKDRDAVLSRAIAEKQRGALVAYVARLREAAKSDTKVNDSLLKAGKQGGGEESEGEP